MSIEEERGCCWGRRSPPNAGVSSGDGAGEGLGVEGAALHPRFSLPPIRREEAGSDAGVGAEAARVGSWCPNILDGGLHVAWKSVFGL